MRKASDDDTFHYQKALLAALQKIGLELSYLRQLKDVKHEFTSSEEMQRYLVVEGAGIEGQITDPEPAKVQPPERVAGESTPPTAIVDWNIKDLAWEIQEPFKDRFSGEQRKGYSYFPSGDGPIKFRSEREKQSYHGMKQAIETFKQANPQRHTMNVEGGYAWIKRDGVTICYREK